LGPANLKHSLLRASVEKRVVGQTQPPHYPELSAALGTVAPTAISRLIGNAALFGLDIATRIKAAKFSEIRDWMLVYLMIRSIFPGAIQMRSLFAHP